MTPRITRWRPVGRDTPDPANSLVCHLSTRHSSPKTMRSRLLNRSHHNPTDKVKHTSQSVSHLFDARSTPSSIIERAIRTHITQLSLPRPTDCDMVWSRTRPLTANEQLQTSSPRHPMCLLYSQSMHDPNSMDISFFPTLPPIDIPVLRSRVDGAIPLVET